MMKLAFNELNKISQSLKHDEIKAFTDKILNCNGKIIGLGAGRMGYSLQAFIMRLSHLGYNSYMIGDTTLPRIGEGDLVIVNSSSGETRSIHLLASLAKQYGASILTITHNSGSIIAKESDLLLTYKPIESAQIMKTAYEQFTYILLDYIAHELSQRGVLKPSEIETNHSILE